jgi:precorrin-4/cobalt-precorrin-4 C11-methyltransferase
VSAGRVRFVGCGPGAADLLTLRAVRALQAADIVIWSPSLLDRQALADHTPAAAEIVEWPPATQHDVEAAFDRAAAERLEVVRLKGGDPTLFGAMEPDWSAARDRGLSCEIVPGVSALSAGAAALGQEIATPAAPLLIAGTEDLARPAHEPPRIAVYNAARDPSALQRALLARGLPASTPCSVAIEVSRRDETLISCTLAELAETVEDMGRGLLTLVLVACANAAHGPPDPP